MEVELDKELLPRELVQKYASEDLDLYALLVGRRVQLDDQIYIDYIGHIYPYGMRLDTLPLYQAEINQSNEIFWENNRQGLIQ